MVCHFSCLLCLCFLLGGAGVQACLATCHAYHSRSLHPGLGHLQHVSHSTACSACATHRPTLAAHWQLPKETVMPAPPGVLADFSQISGGALGASGLRSWCSIPSSIPSDLPSLNGCPYACPSHGQGLDSSPHTHTHHNTSCHAAGTLLDTMGALYWHMWNQSKWPSTTNGRRP